MIAYVWNGQYSKVYETSHQIHHKIHINYRLIIYHNWLWWVLIRFEGIIVFHLYWDNTFRIWKTGISRISNPSDSFPNLFFELQWGCCLNFISRKVVMLNFLRQLMTQMSINYRSASLIELPFLVLQLQNCCKVPFYFIYKIIKLEFF